jgi:hypothetical protein
VRSMPTYHKCFAACLLTVKQGFDHGVRQFFVRNKGSREERAHSLTRTDDLEVLGLAGGECTEGR